MDEERLEIIVLRFTCDDSLLVDANNWVSHLAQHSSSLQALATVSVLFKVILFCK